MPHPHRPVMPLPLPQLTFSGHADSVLIVALALTPFIVAFAEVPTVVYLQLPCSLESDPQSIS